MNVFINKKTGVITLANAETGYTLVIPLWLIESLEVADTLLKISMCSGNRYEVPAEVHNRVHDAWLMFIKGELHDS